MQEREPMSRIVRPLRAGQITIPAGFRRKLGITEESLLRITLDQGELRIAPVRVAEPGKAAQALRDLYAYFAPVRQEAVEKGYSEAEINETIDEAVREVRARAEHA